MKFIEDKIILKGIFDIHVFKKGIEIEHYCDHNLIVNDARETMAHLIGEGDPNKVVTQIAVGTDGNGPTSADTGLTGSFKKNLDGHLFPELYQVKFSFTIDTTEANGMEIKEFGLLCKDGTLFARKTRGVISKGDDISITGTWTILF